MGAIEGRVGSTGPRLADLAVLWLRVGSQRRAVQLFCVLGVCAISLQCAGSVVSKARKCALCNNGFFWPFIHAFTTADRASVTLFVTVCLVVMCRDTPKRFTATLQGACMRHSWAMRLPTLLECKDKVLQRLGVTCFVAVDEPRGAAVTCKR